MEKLINIGVVVGIALIAYSYGFTGGEINKQAELRAALDKGMSAPLAQLECENRAHQRGVSMKDAARMCEGVK